MNVCFLNRSYWPDTGATGQLLTELAEDLAAHHGMKVTVVTGPPLGANASIDLPRRQYRNGVDIIRARGTALPPRRFAARATNYLTYFAAAFIAARRLPPQDVVIALTDPPVIGLAALAARRERPFVFYCQDVFPEVAALLQDFRSPTVDRLLERVNRLLLRRANAVVALGETMATRLVDGKGADRSRISIIHNWADTTAIVPDAQRNPFSEAHGLAAKFVVLHAGNIGQSQNLDSVIDAADELRHCDDVVFVFIGDGTGRESLQAAAVARGLDNVRFIPYQPREHLRWTYATASVFVVSLKPGLAGYIVPSKLYGILASGRPYIAAVEDESEVAEITRRHDCGIQIAPGNARAMARAVLALKDDPARREAMGARARDASTQFDRRRQVAAHAALLRRVSAESAENAARGVRGEGGPRSPRRRRSAENAEKAVRGERESAENDHMKRAFDVTLALAGLVGSAPLWLVIATAIKLHDGGPVLLGQERVGRGGRVFRAWKFRSMIPDAERHTGPVQAVANDPRITPAGRWLRARALDELPQLWNILCGDMSFVGPRPLRPAERDTTAGQSIALDAIPGYQQRHQVRPGLTGLAQVYAARDATRPHKFALDCEYVETRSFAVDLELIARSVWITCCGAWEAVESSRSARSARV